MAKLAKKEKSSLEAEFREKLDGMLINSYFTVVQGPEHSGKSFLTNRYIDDHKDVEKIVKLNIDQSVELSSLIGSYVIVTEKLTKKFEWKEGPLMKCIKEGSILVFDNFELASP